MAEKKERQRSNNEQAGGWFCLVLGVLMWTALSRFIVPVWEEMTDPNTVTAGTTVGMGMGIGMPFFIIGFILLVAGWILLLRNKPRVYSLVFVTFTILAIFALSKLAWYGWRLPYHSPLTDAVDQYSSYSAAELARELDQKVKRYENNRIIGLLIGRSTTEIQALIELLIDKYPTEAEEVLRRISTSSSDQKIREMASNSLHFIKTK